MALATSSAWLAMEHPDLGDFVSDRARTGLPDRYQFYLALFAGPFARTSGAAERIDFVRGTRTVLVEVAFPPFAYMMTIDSDPDMAIDAFDMLNITPMVDVGYDQKAIGVELDLLVGFGHTPYPGDYRTRAMLEADLRKPPPGTLSL